MVTSSIRCPACGASDPSRADANGVHACTYCGSRYRVAVGGRAEMIGGRLGGAPPARQPAIAVAVLALVALAGAGLGAAMFLVESSPEPAAQRAREALVAPLANPTVTVSAPPPEPVTPEVKATASWVEHHRRTAMDGSIWVYGITTNTSPFVIDKVEVIGVLRDADGGEVGTKSGYANRDVLGPGESSSVVVLIHEAPDFASVAWEVDVDRATWVPKMVAGLRVEAGTPVRGRFSGWEMDGKVHHEGTEPARFVKIELQGWSADGRLLGVSDTYAKGEVLAPGESARFKHLGVSFDEEPARFEVLVEGRLAD